ncbi:serine/threonine-protein kinase [Allokutzneria albata]|uniref:non-specific serine/threonine protein kinase n=1 Tax=Allokutzneria albata TaxID=211114 RepID=A0A1G9V9Z3_ALLAB|nr:serine/threonine-protein kinase [Allokutzneria albata]SDM68981.1 Serine/threonine protein kinase [Allokutzneria albata]
MGSERVIAGRYRLEERIGSGAMGVVWRATDTELGRTVALKRSQEGDNGQIRREARIGAGLHHPHVVTVFDVVVDDGERWLVMEHLAARTLAEILDEDGPLAPDVAARIGTQLAAALTAMHERRMVHRDIKPGNVLVAEDGTAKLTDLGIAQWAEVTHTNSGQIGGTPGYLAPEVADGRDAKASADVFSLGATLFAAVEGSSPWGEATRGPFAQLRRAASGATEPMKRAGPLEPVLAKLLSKAPADRPTAAQAKDLLDEITGTSTAVFPLPRKRKRRALALGAAAVAIALAAGAAVYLTRDTVVPGSLGDPRTADPCSLVDPAAVASFGEVTADSEYGEYLRCGLFIKQSRADQDLIVLAVEFDQREEYPEQPYTPGRLGMAHRPPEKNNRCLRAIPLPDVGQVKITTKHRHGQPAPLCAVAEAAFSNALTVLSRGGIPRRRDPFPKESAARLDACTLLGAADLTKVLGVPGMPAEPKLGNWTCYWEKGPVEAEIALTRDWQLTPGPDEDGELIKLGSREAFVETSKAGDDDADVCTVRIVHRKYPRKAAWNDVWDELVNVSVETNSDPLPVLCAKAVDLARIVERRLPAV